MKRTGVYSRQSKGSDRSIEQQYAEQVADVEDIGWTVTRRYADGLSASRFATKKRVDWPQLLADIEAGHLDAVSLWESSRGDRNLATWIMFLDLCLRHGALIRVVDNSRTYDLAIPDDYKALAEAGTDARHESEKTRRRILRDVRANAALGRPHGKILFGYTRAYALENGKPKLVAQLPDPEKAELVREAVRRVLKGEATYSIAQDFNGRGISAPRGGRWDPTQVHRLCVNPAYVGWRVHQGKIVMDAGGKPVRAIWPALIDEKDYTACVARLTDPRRNTVRDRSLKHLLTGAGRCDVCGSLLKVIKNRTVLSYVCAGTADPSRRFCVSVAVAKLDGFVEELIVQRLSRPDALALLTPPDDSAAADAAATEAADLRAELQAWRAAAKARKVIPTSFFDIEADLLERIERAEQRAEQRAQRTPIAPILLDLARPDARKRWSALGVAQKREVVSLLVVLRVGRTYRGARTFDPGRLAESRWRGDTRTWGQIWQAA